VIITFVALVAVLVAVWQLTALYYSDGARWAQTRWERPDGDPEWLGWMFAFLSALAVLAWR